MKRSGRSGSSLMLLGSVLILLFISFTSTVKGQFFQNITPQLVGKNLKVTIYRGKNNCAFKSNPAHDWIFYVNGEQRYRTGLGGAAQMTILIPLKNEDSGTSLELKANIYENKCIGSQLRFVSTVTYGRINIPDLNSPNLSHLTKGVYRIKVKGSDRFLKTSSSGDRMLRSQATTGTRFIFEPTGTNGVYYIRGTFHNLYLKGESPSVKLAEFPYQGISARFEVEQQSNGSYKIRLADNYLYEDRGAERIKLSSNGTSFELEEVDRKVSFLATGDPQLWIGNMADDDPQYQRPKAVLDELGTYTFNNSLTANRGVIISGDLTQNTKMGELREYKKLTESYRGYLFDGLGNHDLNSKRMPFFWLEREHRRPDKFFEYIKRERSQRIAKRESIHYSWNWDDVHFVQLNLFPGNSDSPIGNNSYLAPHNSLDFLKADLEEQVGTSGRPVVLIHHYGMDNTSIVSSRSESAPYGWTEAEVTSYWDLIKDYNIAAIITGHKHSGFNGGTNHSDDAWNPDFERPDSRSGQPDEIPTFVAGGATDGGYYLKFVIDGDNLEVKRYQAKMSGDDFQGTFNFVSSETVQID